ncbi:MAG: TIGR04255 family protein [Bacteroidales bacterium]|nr:TIGR04255 family protein [Bacteroidales bacterium]
MENFKNAPLVEVVFEIKFKDPNGVNYDLIVGELYSKLKSKYPFTETLTPKEFPALVMPFIMQHRFRPEKNKYPLFQIGPGIVSFNIDGSTYTEGWKGYKKNLLSFIRIYKSVFGDEFSAEKIDRISLRYIDKIEDPNMYPDVKKYFDESLKLGIDLNFAEKASNYENLENTSLSQVYKIHDNCNLGFKIKTIKDGSRKLLVDSFVDTYDFNNIDELNKWLEKAHTTLKDFFIDLTSNIKHLFD